MRRDFNLRADARALLEQVAKQYGLEVIFDGDYQAGPVIRFRITDSGYREAIYTLMTVTGSFIVPISDRVFMVVKDTEQNGREAENHIASRYRYPNLSPCRKPRNSVAAVQQLMEIQRFSIDSAQRLVIFRDRASKVRPARGGTRSRCSSTNLKSLWKSNSSVLPRPLRSSLDFHCPRTFLLCHSPISAGIGVLFPPGFLTS